MIHLLPLSLAGGLVALLVQQRRQNAPLVETLVVAEGVFTPSSGDQSLLARFDGISTEQHLALSIGLLGMTTVGHFGLPLLRLGSLPGLFYLDLYFMRNAYREWQAKRQIGIAISDGVLATGLLVTGQWGADSLFAVLFFASRKLQAKAEENLVHALAVEQIFVHDDDNVTPIINVTSIINMPADDAIADLNQATVANRPTWHRWIDQGALPFLTLGAVSMPLLGAKRALAILLANFGYDYRIMAPLSTLSYLAVSKEQGIILNSGQILEKLLEVDTLILDGLWDEEAIASLQLGTSIEIVSPNHIPTTTNGVGVGAEFPAPDLVAKIGELQATGHRVAYLSNGLVNELAATQADIFMSTGQSNNQNADLILLGDPIEKLQSCFEMIPSIVANRKRGLYLTMAPSVINLSGIYFLHFGVITALLVDYGGGLVGMVNALLPRFQAWPDAESKTFLSDIHNAQYEKRDSFLQPIKDSVNQWPG